MGPQKFSSSKSLQCDQCNRDDTTVTLHRTLHILECTHVPWTFKSNFWSCSHCAVAAIQTTHCLHGWGYQQLHVSGMFGKCEHHHFGSRTSRSTWGETRTSGDVGTLWRAKLASVCFFLSLCEQNICCPLGLHFKGASLQLRIFKLIEQKKN